MVVLPEPGGPHSITDSGWRPSTNAAAANRAEQLVLADELVEDARAHAHGQRLVAGGRAGAEDARAPRFGPAGDVEQTWCVHVRSSVSHLYEQTTDPGRNRELRGVPPADAKRPPHRSVRRP